MKTLKKKTEHQQLEQHDSKGTKGQKKLADVGWGRVTRHDFNRSSTEKEAKNSDPELKVAFGSLN